MKTRTVTDETTPGATPGGKSQNASVGEVTRAATVAAAYGKAAGGEIKCMITAKRALDYFITVRGGSGRDGFKTPTTRSRAVHVRRMMNDRAVLTLHAGGQGEAAQQRCREPRSLQQQHFRLRRRGRPGATGAGHSSLLCHGVHGDQPDSRRRSGRGSDDVGRAVGVRSGKREEEGTRPNGRRRVATVGSKALPNGAVLEHLGGCGRDGGAM